MIDQNTKLIDLEGLRRFLSLCSNLFIAKKDAVAANQAITAATKCKVTFDAKGLITKGEDLVASDIPVLDASKVTTGKFSDDRISSAAAWNAKANQNSPELTGIPRTPTADTGTSTTQIASTQFVQQEIDRRADSFSFTVGEGNFVHTTVESITSIL